MKEFSFQTSEKAKEYCNEIISEMVRRFSITDQEAYDRVDQKWNHIESITDDSLIFHMLPEEWAFDIYYGNDSRWWKSDVKNLIPLPYKPLKNLKE